MKDGGRLAAAIEVLDEIENRHRPAQVALKDWGNQHRFAGSGDRTAIGNLVFDVLRHKASLSARLRSTANRHLVLGVYALVWNKGLEQLETVLETDRHAPEPLSDQEKDLFSSEATLDIADHAAADVPEWLWPSFVTCFGDNAVAEGKALATRAPVDLRANLLKSNRDKLLDKLSHIDVAACDVAETGLRIVPKPGALRMPHVQAEEGYRKGWFELQDEASQIVAALSGAMPGAQVLDFCAGGGGKTLAMAGAMQNKGQIYAFDADRLRLAPIHERLQRAGVRNVQVRDPAATNLTDLEGSMDLVFTDAPCTGTGVWRRRPDSKWRLTEKAVHDRIEDQRNVLERAAKYVKPGGRLVYVTCSVLPEENADQIDWFLQQQPEFQSVSAAEAWTAAYPGKKVPTYINDRGDILLTPGSTDTDGFFCALLERRA